MKVFLSWSGETSRKVATALRDWLPCVFNDAKPFVSSEDIRKGNRWFTDVSQELSSSSFGIICLTKENFQAPWILFEAGALSKSLKESQVCTLLLGNLGATDVKGPLAGFQATIFEKEDFKKLVKALNAAPGPKTLADATLERVFEKWWPDLEANVGGILAKETPPVAQIAERTERDMLVEILELARLISRNRPPDFIAQDERQKLKMLLNLDLAEINFSPHVIKMFEEWGIQNIGTLTQLCPIDLKSRGFRKSEISGIESKLEPLGLSLGMRYSDELLDGGSYVPKKKS